MHALALIVLDRLEQIGRFAVKTAELAEQNLVIKACLDLLL